MKTERIKQTQAQKAKLENYQNDWCRLLETKVRKLTFPSMTQGKVTAAQKLAGIMRLIRSEDPSFPQANSTDEQIIKFLALSSRCDQKNIGRLTMMARLGMHLERAVVNGDKEFLADYRKVMSSYMSMNNWRKIYSWMISHYRKVEDCHSPAQIWRLVKDKFSLQDAVRSNFYRTLREVNLPVCQHPSKIASVDK